MYLYFDCFAGFDIFTALGAVLDMTKETAECDALCKKLFPGCVLFHKEVTRSSMEALRAEISAKSGETFSYGELLEYIDSSQAEPYLKEKLCSFVKIIASARCISFEDAKFDMKSFAPMLCGAAYIFSVIKKEKIKNVWVSKPLCSNAFEFTSNGFESVTKPETFYILKKYKIDTSSTDLPMELLTEDGAALLACLDAKNTGFSFVNIVKTGYGAADKDSNEIINILRIVIGSDDEEDILNFETQIEEHINICV